MLSPGVGTSGVGSVAPEERGGGGGRGVKGLEGEMEAGGTHEEGGSEESE